MQDKSDILLSMQEETQRDVKKLLELAARSDERLREHERRIAKLERERPVLTSTKKISALASAIALAVGAAAEMIRTILE